MDNREAIEWLKGCVVAYEVDNKGKPNGNVTCELIQEVIDMAISALEKQERDRWIPVTERLPEENGRYIICYEDATTFLDYFNGKWFFPLGKHAMACEETGTIVAWRPLPEPYTEEES